MGWSLRQFKEEDAKWSDNWQSTMTYGPSATLWNENRVSNALTFCGALTLFFNCQAWSLCFAGRNLKNKYQYSYLLKSKFEAVLWSCWHSNFWENFNSRYFFTSCKFCSAGGGHLCLSRAATILALNSFSVEQSTTSWQSKSENSHTRIQICEFW